MLEIRSLKPIHVNQQTIYWEICSGIAVGVQKYQDKIDLGNYQSKNPRDTLSRLIIELAIQKSDGKEQDIIIPGAHKIKVRDGQRVSVLFGYTASRKSCGLIFVNHDRHKKYWIAKPRDFFESLGLFANLPGKWYGISAGIVVMYMGLDLFSGFTWRYGMPQKNSPPEWATFGMLLGLFGLIFCVAYELIQLYRMRSAWKTIEPQILARINQFID
ncbi:MAG: hypothetical protein VKJ24_17295 [Synechococcales bacterium]|nr:hypothetical protein [Synechococcales bacterium]